MKRSPEICPLKVAVYDSFAMCEAELRNLTNQTGNANPFLTVDWLKLWWHHFGKDKFLYLILFRDKNSAIGFVPFYRIPKPGWGCFELRLLGDGFSSYLDMVCVPGYEEAMVESLFSHLQNEIPAVVINLRDFNDRFSRFFSPISKQLEGKGRYSSAFKLYPCPLAVLGDSWEDFFKKRRSARSRSNLKRRERLFSKIGELGFREVTDPGELAVVLPQLERLHRERFRETLNPLFQGGNRVFLASALNKMLPSHMSLSIVELDGVPVSFIIGFNMGEVFIYFAPAFDPAFSYLPPGHIHLMRLMEQKIDEGCRYFDFSKGEGEYKRQWSNDETTNYLLSFGFNLNILGYLYLKSRDAFLHGFLFLRGKGVNRKIKHWLAKLREVGLFRRGKDKVIVEGLSPSYDLDPAHLPKFSYQRIIDLPVEVRKAIIERGARQNINLMRIESRIEQHEVLLIDEESGGGFVIRY